MISPYLPVLDREHKQIKKNKKCLLTNTVKYDIISMQSVGNDKVIALASSPFCWEGEMISIPLKILKLAYFIWARDGLYTYWSQKPMPERDCVVEHVAPTTQNQSLIKYIIIFISVTIYIMVRWIKTDIIWFGTLKENEGAHNALLWCQDSPEPPTSYTVQYTSFQYLLYCLSIFCSWFVLVHFSPAFCCTV